MYACMWEEKNRKKSRDPEKSRSDKSRKTHRLKLKQKRKIKKKTQMQKNEEGTRFNVKSDRRKLRTDRRQHIVFDNG